MICKGTALAIYATLETHQAVIHDAETHHSTIITPGPYMHSLPRFVLHGPSKHRNAKRTKARKRGRNRLQEGPQHVNHAKPFRK